jgi:hypothetical protein
MRAPLAFIVLVLAASNTSIASARSSDVVRPKSRKEIQRDIVLPASATCEHMVAWAMAAVFFDSEWLAAEAAAQYAEYYSDAIEAPLREGASGYTYFINKDELALMLVVDEKAVRVSCEHQPTQNLALQEALGWND